MSRQQIELQLCPLLFLLVHWNAKYKIKIEDPHQSLAFSYEHLSKPVGPSGIGDFGGCFILLPEAV